MLSRSSALASFSLGCRRTALLRSLTAQPVLCSHTTRAGGPAAVLETSNEAMDMELEQLVRRIHGTATKAAVYVTGGASQVRQACTGDSYAYPLMSTAAGWCQNL
jgi:hypothetical protein